MSVSVSDVSDRDLDSVMIECRQHCVPQEIEKDTETMTS